ncbi:MAG: class I SAM-dependent methyltransferase [Candidatus Latescibacteria bacterium]|nr:class I SAM-dependent methyltransferase [Candidatus Latescibacterota bacterium]
MNEKKTLSLYGREYQMHQAEKYHNRDKNHIKQKIALAFSLFDKYAKKRFGGINVNDIVVADIGSSIGTYAIEFAKLGYASYGIDFDPYAAEICKQVCKHEKVDVTYFTGDLSEWNIDSPQIDIAICFDIFEHLYDDELGAFLQSLRKNLSANGCVIFHTYPTQYSYLFTGILKMPLIPFRGLPQNLFLCLTKIYSKIIDIAVLLIRGKDYWERRVDSRHCNPTTKARLTELLDRAGYRIMYLETAQIYDQNKSLKKLFPKQDSSHFNLIGVICNK